MKRMRILSIVLLPLAWVGSSAAESPRSTGFDSHQSFEVRNPFEVHNFSSVYRPYKPRISYARQTHYTRGPIDTIAIESPKFGQKVKGSDVAVTLSLGQDLNHKSFRARLNGKDVTSHFSGGKCTNDGCQETASLVPSEGLRNGKNWLLVSAVSSRKRIELKRVRFDYQKTSTGTGGSGGLGDSDSTEKYLPSAVGFSLNAGGAAPWATITTGTPASLQDTIDQTKYSIPYADTTSPSESACGTTLQVLVLSRSNPTHENAYQCFSDSAALKAYFATLDSTDLVIAGTTAGQKVPGGLDTSGIGGTNYGQTAAALYPQGYVIIGVPGARAGSAYENYYVPGTAAMPYQYADFATGTLSADVNGNYNFHPGDNRRFTISPNDSTAKTSVITIGTQTYTAPAGSASGFWLLIVDRMLLQPVDSSTSSGAPCQYNASSASGCGKFYPTGSTNAATASSAIAGLAAALQGVSPRSLAILTTVGQPFASASAVTADLASAFALLGGSRYTLHYLTSPTLTYTLIAPGATSPRSPFSSEVATSTSLFGQQHQTGFLTGVLARELTSLYAPTVSAQADGKQNAAGATSITPDFSFYEITSQSPVDWPLTDTSGHIAAYHYASAEFMSRHYSETGSHSEDLRYFYAGMPSLGQYNTDFLPGNPGYPVYPGAGAGFTAQDLTTASAQLYSELTALNDTDNYLGDEGLGGLVKGGNGSSVAGDVIAATYEILNGQVGAAPGTSVSESTAGWMNLVAGVASVAAAALGPLEIPVAAAAIGVVSGELWAGSAAISMDDAADSTPPSYENTFDTTLGQMQENASTYAANLVLSYDTALDTIYTDWGKLQATGAKTADSDSGWSFSDQLTIDALGQELSAGVNRYIYLQLLPKFYQLDAYVSSPVSNSKKLGMYFISQQYEFGNQYSCSATYPASLPSAATMAYPHIGNTSSSDIFVIAGAINHQDTLNVSESLPSQSLITTLFAPDPNGSGTPTPGYLNLPMDPIYSNDGANGGFLTYRSGPTQGQGLCYDPGCVSHNPSNQCNAISSK